jgi:ketosteroid isomerase-like protein
MESEDQIRALFQKFQDGYTRRDVAQLDPFMELFTADAEVIGTNGIRPGENEWYTSRSSAKELVKGDWENWGDLRLNMDSLAVKLHGDCGWAAAVATVTQRIGKENYESYLGFVKDFLNNSDLPAEQKLHYILRGGTNTIYELERGEKFTWTLRLTAVVVRQTNEWRFAQMHFSFPTIYFPDVRIMDHSS